LSFSRRQISVHVFVFAELEQQALSPSKYSCAWERISFGSCLWNCRKSEFCYV